MVRKFYFFVVIVLFSSLNILAQDLGSEPNSRAETAIEQILENAVDDFTKGFTEGFNNSIGMQITAFEERTDARTDLTNRQKATVKEDFRRSMIAIMGGVRDRTLKEMKIAEAFKNKLSEFYRSSYTEAELIELGKFYSTPLGKKVKQNQSNLQRFIQDFSKSLLDERFFKIVDEETKKNLAPTSKEY